LRGKSNVALVAAQSAAEVGVARDMSRRYLSEIKPYRIKCCSMDHGQYMDKDIWYGHFARTGSSNESILIMFTKASIR